jgi:hypothetical protein
MSLGDLTSREAVVEAIAEFEAIGREAFLDKYGFGRARAYFLEHQDRWYDSKAIVGAAHGYQFPEKGPLQRTDFSGGKDTVQRKLESLGFEVHIDQEGLVPYEHDYRSLPSTPQASDLSEPMLPERIRSETYRILRDTALARSLKNLHGHRCQICGTRIPLGNGEFYSETHHIKPLGEPHCGPDVAENIIVLCPNHHVQCDYGAIRLSKQDLRKHPRHRIGDRYIEYHNSEICAA